MISTTLSQGRRFGYLAVVGNGTGILCHLLATAFGLAQLMRTSPSICGHENHGSLLPGVSGAALAAKSQGPFIRTANGQTPFRLKDMVRRVSGQSAESKSTRTDAGFDAAIRETGTGTRGSSDAAAGLRAFGGRQQRLVNSGSAVCDVGSQGSEISRPPANTAEFYGRHHDSARRQSPGFLGTGAVHVQSFHTNGDRRNATLMKAAVTAKLQWLKVILFLILLLSVLARYWWVADVLANLRMQCFIGATLILLLAMLLRSPKDVLHGFLLAMMAAWPLLPGISLVKSDKIADLNRLPALDAMHDRLQVCVCNVLSSNRRYDDTLGALTEHDPDVI